MLSEIEKEKQLMENAGVKTKLSDDQPYDKRRIYHPTEGNTWNPLRDWPRNAVCFCGSDKKFKKCHMGKIPTCVSLQEAENSRKALDAFIAGVPVRLVAKERIIS